MITDDNRHQRVTAKVQCTLSRDTMQTINNYQSKPNIIAICWRFHTSDLIAIG